MGRGWDQSLDLDNAIRVKYDPMGNRVWKETSDGVNSEAVKFIVDVNSQLPVILCELKADSSSPDFGSLKKSYYYADAQVLHQRHHDPVDPNLFDPSYYVQDRLGSVRLVVVPEYDEQQQEWVVRAANSTTYTPFGQLYEGQAVETLANPWKFTGQWHDAEIDQYHLRARQYDPAMMRFTSRDPVRGKYHEPLTLHKYLYCLNDPVNLVDPDGRFAVGIAARLVIGGLVGGMTAGSRTDWDARAMAVGTVTGMFSAAIPGKIMGAIGGSLLSGASTAYSSYINQDSPGTMGARLVFNAAGNALSAGLFGGLNVGDGMGLLCFVAGKGGSYMASYMFGTTFNLGFELTNEHANELMNGADGVR